MSGPTQIDGRHLENPCPVGRRSPPLRCNGLILPGQGHLLGVRVRGRARVPMARSGHRFPHVVLTKEVSCKHRGAHAAYCSPLVCWALPLVQRGQTRTRAAMARGATATASPDGRSSRSISAPLPTSSRQPCPVLPGAAASSTTRCGSPSGPVEPTASAGTATFTSNIWAVQALGPEFVFWYVPQVDTGSVVSATPPTAAWPVSPASPPPLGGEFTTSCCGPPVTCSTTTGACTGASIGSAGRQCASAGGTTQCCDPSEFWGQSPWVTVCGDGRVTEGCNGPCW